jgi:hypothetical protein
MLAERWSKYPVSEENMAIIDYELKREFFEIMGMEISTPEEWLGSAPTDLK